MLEFLNSVGSFIGNNSDAISQVMGIFQKQPKAAPVERPPQPESERYAISLLKALAEPGNSLVKSMAAEEFMNLMSGMQGDVRSKVLADRRERSMGRGNVFFDPERTDENIAYQLSRGGAQLRQTAQSNAIERIMKAANVGNYSGAEDKREQLYQTAIGEREKLMAKQGNSMDRLTQGLSGLEKILGAFGKPSVVGQRGATTGPYQSYYPSVGTINWEQNAKTKPMFGPYQNFNMMTY